MKTENGTKSEVGTVYIGENRKYYGSKVNVSGIDIKCLSKKQLKALYPNRQYQIVAEYAPDGKYASAGVLKYNNADIQLTKYKSHTRIVYQEKGYVKVGEDSFVVLLKNAVLVRAAVFACMILIAAAVYAAVNLIPEKTSEVISDDASTAAVTSEQAIPDLEEGAVDWEGALPRDTGGVTQGIAIPGYKSITIDADATQVRVNLQNPQGNPCYFVISLILDDGTVLYKSKMIEPGKGLYEIELTEPLDIGEYPAVVKYETFSLQGLSPLNGAEVKITLIAE